VQSFLPRDVKKALALLEADPARERRVSELAAASGVASRTLQKHFRFLGRTPLKAQCGLRMERARRDCCVARPRPV
jgi:transcriptional regulator GlxA family with amidase domain